MTLTPAALPPADVASPLPVPENAIAALDAARSALMESHALMGARMQEAETRWRDAEAHLLDAQKHLAAVQHEANSLREARDTAMLSLSQLKSEYSELQGERDRWKGGCQEAEARVHALHQQVDEVGRRAAQHAERADEQAHRAEEAQAQTRAVEARLQQQQQAHEREAAQWRAQLEDEGKKLDAQKRRSHELRRELLEMHYDLMASDVPTLILRVAMNLTGAESGLFVDETGRCPLASIGLDEMPPEVADSLFDFTEQALQEEEPLVCNDGHALPDGQALVNLAALPVAVQSDQRGAILVANKRGGAFTEEDTELLLSIGKHAGVAMENRRLHAKLAESYTSTIAVLADAIEAKDPYTRGHCESVSKTAVGVAERMGMDANQKDGIRYAALLHDVGKIGISDGILLKPGKLLPEEFQLIQRHATIGSDLVKRVPALCEIAPMILHHHERMDGSGYPDGLSSEQIPMGARIIGVVDALDAMTTPRPYREPVSIPEALKELQRCAGTQFDREVVDAVGHILSERGDLAE